MSTAMVESSAKRAHLGTVIKMEVQVVSQPTKNCLRIPGTFQSPLKNSVKLRTTIHLPDLGDCAVLQQYLTFHLSPIKNTRYAFLRLFNNVAMQLADTGLLDKREVQNVGCQKIKPNQ